MIDVFILDAVYSLLDADLDCLDDAAFGEAVRSQAAYLSGIIYDQALPKVSATLTAAPAPSLPPYLPE